MKRASKQYLVGSLLLAFSVYQLWVPDFWEFSLYATTGLAFLVMGMIASKRFPKQNKLLTALSWILILASVFLLLFLVRTDV